MPKTSICILPKLKGTGGPSSFQSKLIKGLDQKGISVNHDPRDPSTSAVLITGGTKQFGDLMYAKRNGIRIVQRLDGMNWLHKKKYTGVKHYLRSERMNFQLSITRRYFADAVVYQSKFTRDWWHTVYGPVRTPHTVIYNGVDLALFSPSKENTKPLDTIRLLVVEGSFRGGHDRDLFNAVELANHLTDKIHKPVELLIAGNVPEAMKAHIPAHPLVTVNWLGLVPHNEIPQLDRSAHLLFPAEINAACPNSLIEGLACGLPVVSYATGSLPELIGESGGIVVPYGSDYWKLEAPGVEALAKAAHKIIDDLPSFKRSARIRAEDLFGVNQMVEKYQQILLEDLTSYPI